MVVDQPALLVSAACLGVPNGACDRNLTASIGAQADNACLVVAVDDDISAFPYRWRGELTPAGAPPRIPRVADAQVEAAVFFLSDGASASCDESLAPSSGCGDGCVARLSATPVLMPTSGDITFEFLSEGRCQLTWAGAPPEDDCDGADQDCDAVLDEGTPGLGDICTAGQGICASMGSVVCRGEGALCDATPGQPRAGEQDNGLDDDCDGTVDEDVLGCMPGMVMDCGVDLGACSAGQRRCDENGVLSPCLDGAGLAVTEPSPETCDGVDEDCDGTIDEEQGLGGDGPLLGEACSVGVGSCQADGMVVCGDVGAAVCNALPAQPRNELCDGFDDDCDGAIDEEFGVGDPCEDGVGACFQQGLIECLDGAATCSVSAGMPAVEACDTGIDEDCDGTVDEGFDELAQACSVGLGICRVEGLLQCNPQDLTELACDIEPLPSEEEACNQLDDDCDGQVDEAFDLAADPANCGACGRACETPNAESECAAGDCVVGDCLEGFEDTDGDPTNGCECAPLAEDDPDPLFQDVNCDGVDGDAERGVFVALDGGDDINAGTIDAPVQSLAAAAALLTEERRSIYLAAGRYPMAEPWDVPDGVGLYGGYLYDGERTWLRGPRAQAETVLSGPPIVLRYRDLVRPTALENLTVEAADGGVGESSIAIVVLNGGDTLRLVDVALRAGRGGDGADGAAGENGALVAEPGEPGAPSDGVCPSCGGIGGGNPRCLGIGGGSGAGSNQPDAEAGNGEGGAGAANATPGEAAAPGDPGDPGVHGESAPGFSLTGSVDDGVWRSGLGGDGVDGLPGGGGGGGGLGGEESVEPDGTLGGGGGGGGAGACPGTAGTGAQGGGASIGLLIQVGIVTQVRVSITTQAGGDGGIGGLGGLGARGAEGGPGGAGCVGCGDGGDGGRGGDGGCGGHGASGAGGPSVGILLVGPGDPQQSSAARFADDAGEPAPIDGVQVGQAGSAGAAPSRDSCPDGAAGAAGVASVVGCCSLVDGACQRLGLCL